MGRQGKLVGLLAGLMFLVAPTALVAQLAGTPLRAGLWENQVEMNGNGHPMTRQVCYSTKQNLDDYIKMTLNRMPGIQCSVSNKVQTGHSMTLDQACTGNGMQVKSHSSFSMPDSEHVTGTSHTVSTGTMQGHPVDMTLDTKFTSHFVSADCGTVQPTTPGMPPTPPGR